MDKVRIGIGIHPNLNEGEGVNVGISEKLPDHSNMVVRGSD